MLPTLLTPSFFIIFLLLISFVACYLQKLWIPFDRVNFEAFRKEWYLSTLFFNSVFTSKIKWSLHIHFKLRLSLFQSTSYFMLVTHSFSFPLSFSLDTILWMSKFLLLTSRLLPFTIHLLFITNIFTYTEPVWIKLLKVFFLFKSFQAIYLYEIKILTEF